MELNREVFEVALEYAYKVVRSINSNPVDQEDLIQEFSYQVLSKPEKYNPILQHKSTVYNILKGINSNQKRKMKPFYTDTIPDSAAPNDLSYQEPTGDEKSRDYIESILYASFQSNGRKDSVLSYDKQIEILEGYEKRIGNMREFCSKHGISTGTLHRIRTQGPKKPETPKAITYFLMHHFEGKSLDEISDMHNVSKHSIIQRLHDAKKKITEYFESYDLMNPNLEQVPF